MFHTDATQLRHFRLYDHTTRSLLTTAITTGTLLAFLLTFVVHLTLAWSNGQAAALVLGQPNFTTATGGTSATTMNQPTGVAIDPSSGKVFVAEFNNNRVLRFASVGSLSNGSAAEAVLGQPGFGSSKVATTATGMNSPESITVDSGGHLWVTDNRNYRVLRFDNAASKTNGAAADGVLGQPDFVTKASGVAAANNFAVPRGVAVDNSGNLWVSDSNFSRVLRFNNAAGKSNGANADSVLGQTSFTTSGSGLSASSFNAPFGVAADSTGHLWVVDALNNRVLRFDNAAGKPNGANADGVLGQSNFVSNAAATSQNGMNTPFFATTDTAGTLWVSDINNNRVLRFDSAAGKSNGAKADGVLGQPDFVSNAAATTQNGLNFALGLAVDSSNNLWVADANNNRALYFINKDAATATPTATSTNTSTFTPSNTATFTPSNTNTATITPSNTNTATITPSNTVTSTSTTTPTLSQIDTIGIFRSGSFYLRLYNSLGNSDINATFNPPGTKLPIVGDWTGAHYDSIGVYDQSAGRFSLRNTITAGSPDEQFLFGNPNDTPLSGRWFAAATHAGVGVYRPSNGILYVQNALTTGFSDHAMVLGNPSDQGIAGDWTGRGYDGLGVFRPTGNTFYLLNQVSDGIVVSDINFQFGSASDVAITGDWIGQGHDGVGVFRPANVTMNLKNVLVSGSADNTFNYGSPTDQPIAGHWQVIYPPVAPKATAPVLIPKTAASQPTIPGNSAPGGNQIGG